MDADILVMSALVPTKFSLPCVRPEQALTPAMPARLVSSLQTTSTKVVAIVLSYIDFVNRVVWSNRVERVAPLDYAEVPADRAAQYAN